METYVPTHYAETEHEGERVPLVRIDSPELQRILDEGVGADDDLDCAFMLQALDKTVLVEVWFRSGFALRVALADAPLGFEAMLFVFGIAITSEAIGEGSPCRFIPVPRFSRSTGTVLA